MLAVPPSLDYRVALNNLLTLWGYETSLRVGDMLKVMKPGIPGSGFTGYTFWELEIWIAQLKAHDEWIAKGGSNLRIIRPMNVGILR